VVDLNRSVSPGGPLDGTEQRIADIRNSQTRQKPKDASHGEVAGEQVSDRVPYTNAPRTGGAEESTKCHGEHIR
jgi:hypothetical protein